MDGSSKLKIAASKKETSGTNWVQILKEQNNLYEYPILRRINELKVFYITAVASNTSKESHWDKVVINGWEPVSRDEQHEPKYYCCFETDGRMELGEVVKKHTWGFRIPGVIAAVQFICSVPVTARHKRVALTATPVCKELGLKFVDIEYAFMQPDNTIGVCAKIAYGEFPADRILEWFEINKEMGADHIVLFTYNLTKQSRGALDFYSRSGYLETKDFDFPMKSKFSFLLSVKKRNLTPKEVAAKLPLPLM